MATEIKEGAGIGPSEAQEKREWDDFVKWADHVEGDLPLAEAFILSLHLANILTQLAMPERMIESAWKINDRLREKLQPLKPEKWLNGL